MYFTQDCRRETNEGFPDDFPQYTRRLPEYLRKQAVLRLISLLSLLAAPLSAHDAEWPDDNQNFRPTIRWWWPADLSPEDSPTGDLEKISAAGFGGVEVQATEPSFGGASTELEWLSPAWVARVSEASKTAEQLGLTFDLSCNGPTFGNLPAIPPCETAIRSVPIITTAKGGPFEYQLPRGGIDCLGAWPAHGDPIDLLPFIDLETQVLKWDAPPGLWRIYGIGREATDFPDHFSTVTATNALAYFTDAFMGSDAPFPRAHTLNWHDLDTDWSSALVAAFQRRRGYDLREQLPALYGDADVGTAERVLCDYRETLADLQRDTLITWHKWTHEQGTLSRTHIEGLGGNPIDLHGVPDIPGFCPLGLPTDEDLPLLSFAASAAHLHAKPLISATAFHATEKPAQITPAQMKSSVDLLWLAGANSLVLDGLLDGSSDDLLRPINSPQITPLGESSGRWQNIRAFNDYIKRSQSILQSGAPDPEVLLYYPTHDFLTERGGVPLNPAEQTPWFRPTAFHLTAESLANMGVPCDYVTDLILQNATVSHGRIVIGGLSYKTLILPRVRQLPEITARQILELTRRGAKITILGDWPRDVPGLPMPDIRRGTLFTSFQGIPSSQIIEGDELLELLLESGVSPEPMASRGLKFVRRTHAEGWHYFIVNRSHQRIDEWIPLATPATSAILMDPRFLKRSGIAKSRTHDGQFEVRLALEPGESRILKTLRDREAEGPNWNELTPADYPRAISGIWKVEFIEGGPELPDEFETPVLGSWTTIDDPRVDRFSGTARYSIEIEVPDDGNWLLDLGEVAHTARIFINGNEAGSVFAPPHRFDISRFLKQGTNTLAVEVTNLRQTTDDTYTAPLTSGLLGPVRLIPLEEE